MACQGSVKFFSDKGFGFILPADGGKDVFLHITGTSGFDQADLIDGAAVTYSVTKRFENGVFKEELKLHSLAPPVKVVLPEPVTVVNIVKFYDQDKGFGYLHATPATNGIDPRISRQSCEAAGIIPGKGMAMRAMVKFEHDPKDCTKLRASVASFEAGPEIETELQAAVAKMNEELAKADEGEVEEAAAEAADVKIKKPKNKKSGTAAKVTRTRRTTEPEPAKTIKDFEGLAGAMGTAH